MDLFGGEVLLVSKVLFDLLLHRSAASKASEVLAFVGFSKIWLFWGTASLKKETKKTKVFSFEKVKSLGTLLATSQEQIKNIPKNHSLGFQKPWFLRSLPEQPLFS